MSRSWLRVGLVVAVLLAAWLLWRSGLLGQLDLASLKAHRATLQGWVAGQPLLAASVFALLYVIVAALSLPGAAILTLAAGALFGLMAGTLLASFASSIGATLAFLASRFLFRDSVRRRFGPRLQAFDAGIARDGAFYLFGLRLVPAAPFFIVNLLAGLTTLPTPTFYWVSQLGMLPATLAFVFAGTRLAEIESLGDVLSPGVLLAFGLLALLPLLMRAVLRRLEARKVYGGHARPRRFDYNLVVIGGGSAGLVSAYIAAVGKAKVALIERHRMGGDCLNTGCVPSKALLRTAKLAQEIRKAGHFGLVNAHADVDFPAVMARVHDVIAKIEPHDSVERYTGLGVEVIQGDARLVSPWEIEVDGRRLTALSVIVATGASPLVPPIPGLDQVPYLTSDNLWDLRELPGRLLVLGGGPIGCELSQAFARLGSQVTQVEMAPRLLPREDADAAEQVRQQFEAEDIDVRTGYKALRVETEDGVQQLVCEHQGNEVALPFDRILLALGRKANVSGFGLEELGVRLSPRKTIEANAFLRTNIPNIYVAGDVAGPYQFTHVAAHQAWYASVNALLAPWWSFKADYRVIPWATFTDPEVARVGLSEDEAQAQGIDVEVTRYCLDDLDRAIADGSDHGFVKVLTAPGSDRILGAAIIGAHAGDLLAEFVLAMKHGIGLNKLLGTIHTYPTLGEANKYVAGTWKRAHAPERLLAWAERLHAWRRA
jgi:pyruvate/2-oxoglutarate dehydrogenase complex dihydrolipoamide dehydrogenase (E3) component/uncharacterized membrane protein YdjX (TVP38/TMEM64 family)